MRWAACAGIVICVLAPACAAHGHPPELVARFAGCYDLHLPVLSDGITTIRTQPWFQISPRIVLSPERRKGERGDDDLVLLAAPGSPPPPSSRYSWRPVNADSVVLYFTGPYGGPIAAMNVRGDSLVGIVTAYAHMMSPPPPHVGTAVAVRVDCDVPLRPEQLPDSSPNDGIKLTMGDSVRVGRSLDKVLAGIVISRDREITLSGELDPPYRGATTVTLTVNKDSTIASIFLRYPREASHDSLVAALIRLHGTPYKSLPGGPDSRGFTYWETTVTRIGTDASRWEDGSYTSYVRIGRPSRNGPAFRSRWNWPQRSYPNSRG
jgi:hypothetical protein